MVLGLQGTAIAVPVVPNFTSGTITADTTSTTKIVETIRQQDYSNGYTYVVTGTNVRANDTGLPVPSPASLPVPGNGTAAVATPVCVANTGNICYGTSFSVINQGQPFQLTETYNGPGIFRETAIDRVTDQTTRTISTSVFTQ